MTSKRLRVWLQKFDGRNKIPIESIAMLSDHHVSNNYDGYATHDCFIFKDSFRDRNLAATVAQGPPSIVDCPKSTQDATGKGLLA
jgi:hypothetical protein